MNRSQAISVIEDAGRYLATSRGLEAVLGKLNATQAARHPDPDVQAFAIFSVLLARVVYAKDDGWVKEVCNLLGIKEAQ